MKTNKLFAVFVRTFQLQTIGGTFNSEGHFYLVASDSQSAIQKAHNLELVQRQHLVVEGVQEIEMVEGHTLNLTPTNAGEIATVVRNYPLKKTS